MFVGILCLSLFFYVLLCVLSSFAILLKRKRERVGCFAFIVLRMSCYCKSSVTLPRGAVGWSAVCDYFYRYQDLLSTVLTRSVRYRSRNNQLDNTYV